MTEAEKEIIEFLHSIDVEVKQVKEVTTIDTIQTTRKN